MKELSMDSDRIEAYIKHSRQAPRMCRKVIKSLLIIDVKELFDEVKHDILMSRLARTVL